MSYPRFKSPAPQQEFCKNFNPGHFQWLSALESMVFLTLLKLPCLTQDFNPNVQQGQRESASQMKRLMLLWMGEKPEGDCCPSMRILSCRIFFLLSTANKVYGLQWGVCHIKISLFTVFPHLSLTWAACWIGPGKADSLVFQFSLLIACLS